MGHEEDHVFFADLKTGGITQQFPPQIMRDHAVRDYEMKNEAAVEKKAANEKKKAAVGFNARSETCDFGMKYWNKSQNGPEW